MKCFIIAAFLVAAASAQNYLRVQDDPDRLDCIWRNLGASGYILFYKGDMVMQQVRLRNWDDPTADKYDSISWRAMDPTYTKPPRNWDGSFSSLPYPKPDKTSGTYTALLCYPLLSEGQVKEPSIFTDPSRKNCQWKASGKKWFYPSGQTMKFPAGLRFMENPYGGVTVDTVRGTLRPSPDWDGTPSTLGFPVPPKGTPEYNMLLCWPYDMTFKAKKAPESNLITRIQDDPDRDNCIWKAYGLNTHYLEITNSEGATVQMYIDRHFNGIKEDYDKIRWTASAPLEKKPPMGWDGSFYNLAYPKPAKDSDLYKYLLCWPYLPEDATKEENILADENRKNCQWVRDESTKFVDPDDYYNYWENQVGDLPGGFPKDYRITQRKLWTPYPSYNSTVTFPDGFNTPPSNWNGRESTLGYPVPAKGTPEYNMLLCWPFDITPPKKDAIETVPEDPAPVSPVVPSPPSPPIVAPSPPAPPVEPPSPSVQPPSPPAPPVVTPSFNRIQDDPDRSKCNWQGSADGFKTLTFGGEVVDKYINLSNKWKLYSPSNRNTAVYWSDQKNSIPPASWNGSFASLPYPKPEKDSALYKFLLCWPLLSSQEETSTELSILEDDDGWNCRWHSDIVRQDRNGTSVYYYYPKDTISGGFPSEFRVAEKSTYKTIVNRTEIDSPVGYPRPPHDWDGRPSTLGFPMPAKNTPEYNMLLCWPYDVTFTAKDATEYPNRIQDNPDRSKCNWQGTAQGHKLLTFGGDLVDEGNMRLSQHWKRFYNRNLSVFWFEHDNSTPPSDWDGSFDSLPFAKPKKDSALYKFLLCWPIIPAKEETSTELSILDDNDIRKCDWDSDIERYDKNGVEVYYFYPKGNIKGGFPSGYRTSEVATWELKANQSEIESPVGYPRPPQNWDGRPSTLGYPMPAKNTPEYNMLLCWPYDVTFTKQ